MFRTRKVKKNSCCVPGKTKKSSCCVPGKSKKSPCCETKKSPCCVPAKTKKSSTSGKSRKRSKSKSYDQMDLALNLANQCLDNIDADDIPQVLKDEKLRCISKRNLE